jgi:hypothetical protein
MDLSMKKKMISAPTHAVLKNLAFVTGRGLKDEFLGIPRTAVDLVDQGHCFFDACAREKWPLRGSQNAPNPP